MFLVSDVFDFDTSSLGVLRLNVDNDLVSDFELKLMVDKITSFAGTVSWLFTDLSVLNPVYKLVVSKGLDDNGDSKLKVLNCVSFGLSILFLIDSAKLKVIGILLFASVFTVDTLEKLKGLFSFNSVVPEIISKVDLVEFMLWASLKFKGLAVVDFILKFTGSLLEVLVEITLFPNNGVVLVELKTIGSLVNVLNLVDISLREADLGVELFSIGFQAGAFVVKGIDPIENVVKIGTLVICGNITEFVGCVGCVVGINKGFLNCVKLDLADNGNFVSVIVCVLTT